MKLKTWVKYFLGLWCVIDLELIVIEIYMIYQRKKAGIVTCVTVFLLWLTYLLGPVALVRYVLFLYVLVPVEYLLIKD